MEEGRWKKGDGRREMEEGRWKKGDGRREMEEGRWKLFTDGKIDSAI
jgi:hypothetical protein